MDSVNIDINFDDFKVRCSAITKVLANSASNPCITDKQAVFLKELEDKEKITPNQQVELTRLIQLRENSTKIILSDTCIDYLMESYSWIIAGKISVSKESMDLLQTKKGKMVETDSIELLSILDDVFYQKNDQRVNNNFLSGEPDIFTGEDIYAANSITDAKSLWDYPGFLKSIHKGLENGYKQQVQGYCDICSSNIGQVAKILVNTPLEIVEDMKWKVAKKFGAVTIENPDFLKEWEIWERSMYFDDISMQQRVFKINVDPFTEPERQRVYDRVKICREWLNNFHKDYQKMNR